ncbi:MAG: glycosyltransferase [Chitinophagaceae bacterium]|nr:MAG: glycosyltransferase [Chitinophagaceae bacterium]
MRERYGVDRYLLCVSRMEPRKNQNLLVRAFQELNLAAEGYQLVLIGNRSLQVPEFDEALAALKSYERAAVWILENIPDQELHDWYRGCRLFVYPSLGEGFGIPPLEAAMAEVPVLCSNKTALADFDFFGDDLVDPTDTKAFTARLNQLLQTPPQPGIFAQRAQTIANRYSWKASADILMQQVYQHQAQMIRR